MTPITPIPDVINPSFVRDVFNSRYLEVDALIEALAATSITLAFEATEKPKASGIYNFIMPFDLTVDSDCTGSVFYNATNPSTTVTVSITKNGTEFATLTVTSAGVATWGGTAATIDAGERIGIVFGTQDSTWAGVVITLRGVRT
jgi:hypothetical protein